MFYPIDNPLRLPYFIKYSIQIGSIRFCIALNIHSTEYARWMMWMVINSHESFMYLPKLLYMLRNHHFFVATISANAWFVAWKGASWTRKHCKWFMCSCLSDVLISFWLQITICVSSLFFWCGQELIISTLEWSTPRGS